MSTVELSAAFGDGVDVAAAATELADAEVGAKVAVAEGLMVTVVPRTGTRRVEEDEDEDVEF